MNYFKLFSVLQGIAIAMLCVAVFQLSGQIEELSSNPNNLTASTMSDSYNSAESSAISQDDLRIVMREELQSHLFIQEASSEQRTASIASDAVVIAVSEPSLVRAVDESIEYHISMGSISNGDMGNLESDIAKLDPSNRTAMLSKLVQAMNDGRLNGRL